ncbi:EF-hand domain-containing protein [Candidatus Phycosocius spiralis]|uniref:EF-hand domain-containing protein n=1 Tax=Candidatus Phycosocius spiralis TaxID=2815099 RepID=A0ABQ4PUN3_9PROT|nr:EF-hand domain-containing protein [Candidatus Phycosocius spiralis]GIU66691.1 hypothetical protein PsB1_0845 [Candidatus Phycosocius spiralis]
MQSMSVNPMQRPDATALAALRQKFFTKADTDGDGQLSLSEFKAAIALNDSAKAINADAIGGSEGVKKAPPAHGKIDMTVEDLFSSMDTDGDGQVSSKEHEAFEPKMGQDTMNALLSLQGFNQNVQPTLDSSTDAAMTDIIKQLQSILDKFKEHEKQSTQHSVRV